MIPPNSKYTSANKKKVERTANTPCKDNGYRRAKADDRNTDLIDARNFRASTGGASYCWIDYRFTCAD